jgi:hypothetical protein
MNNSTFKRITLIWSFIGLSAIIGCTQQSVQSREKVIDQPQGVRITLKGKIDFMKNLGGYFVLGYEPGGEYFIMNEDPKALEELYKSGKTLIIEGLIVRGAEYLFIEKIDGKEYRGKMDPAQR